MIKILLTNNSALVDSEYDKVYTDSPYVIEKYNNAVYLDTLLDKNIDEAINDIRIKGYEINKNIIDIFFPKYKNRNINIVDIKVEFTNIFINIVKLYKLIELYPNDEITIKVTKDELYNYDSLNSIDRFVNVYYWISNFVNKKNIKLICKNITREDLLQDHLPINSWFLRLIDLDKKVLFFNFLKKFNLINKNKNKIYLYKKSPFLREIEPYLYDLGYNLVDMPSVNFKFNKNYDGNVDEKLKNILERFFENNSINHVYKETLFVIYKKAIQHYLQKEKYTEKYISKLDKSIKIIVTNTINGFDSYIFAKQLQENGYKIINVMHGFSTSFKRKKDFDFYECEAPDMTLCLNSSEKKMYKEFVPEAILHPISLIQEAKIKRLKFFKRLYVNRMLKINDNVNIFYPSNMYPFNNVTMYGYRLSDKLIYDFEKKLILLLSKLNKRVIYKDYPRRCYIDSNPINKYVKDFKNIKAVGGSFDFRYVSSIGDIFILGVIGSSSTLTWMLGENKPIIFLYTNKSSFINEEGRKKLEKLLIVVNIDEDNWMDNLTNILNKPYDELLKIWIEKKFYRDLFDEDWLMGTNLHAGKLGSKYINRFILENNKK